MLVSGVQVAGLRWFVGPRWREAIQYYLKGLAVRDEDVLNRPKLFFTFDGTRQSVVLRLDGDRYIAYGSMDSVPSHSAFPMIGHSHATDVESGLSLLVRKGGRPMTIVLPAPANGVSTMSLWVHENGSELCVSGYNIPMALDAMRELVGQVRPVRQ